jgi:hypothetical protein
LLFAVGVTRRRRRTNAIGNGAQSDFLRRPPTILDKRRGNKQIGEKGDAKETTQPSNMPW